MVNSFVAGLDVEAAVIAPQIIDYMKRNSMAADTRRGVIRWWLTSGEKVDPEAVGRALDHLVKQGFLESRRLPSGDYLYSAATKQKAGH